MNLKEKIKSGKFIVTSEIGPPKGVDLKEMLEDAELIKGKVDGINVTDLQSSVMRVGSLAVCSLLKQNGHEPIFQMTCRDRNRLALESDLLSAYVLGVENVLALTGDYTSLGDHPQAKAVFDLDAVQLLDVIRTLEGGKDMVGNDLKGAPEFCRGAVVNPGADPIEPEIIKLEKKVDAGVEFIQTQAVYDVNAFKKFRDMTKHIKVPIFGGIVLLKSAGMAKFMNENVAGITVPDDLISEMKETPKEDRKKKSVEIAARIIKGMKDYCQGIHIMSIGWDKLVPQVIEAANL